MRHNAEDVFPSPIRISIHAPTWGATSAASRCSRSGRNFNPRTHVGCDVREPRCFLSPFIISIHAPTWGATADFGGKREYVGISIHAPTWGATYSASYPGSDYPFQSTHPRGVRRVRPAKVLLFSLFQSTHPRGVRPLKHNIMPSNNEISIHAPTWGATNSTS